jgi:hypothetical protein
MLSLREIKCPKIKFGSLGIGDNKYRGIGKYGR